jgi:hypothetical protein
MEIKGLIGRSLALASRVWTITAFSYGVRGDKFYFKLFPGRDKSPGIDERIAQIDIARESLKAGLAAVDDLKVTAQRNREDLKSALERLEQIHQDKTAAEKEVKNVKYIAQADIEVFKRLAGVPSRADIARERFIGFVVGVAASLVASLMFWYLTK